MNKRLARADRISTIKYQPQIVRTDCCQQFSPFCLFQSNFHNHFTSGCLSVINLALIKKGIKEILSPFNTLQKCCYFSRNYKFNSSIRFSIIFKHSRVSQSQTSYFSLINFAIYLLDFLKALAATTKLA